MTFVLPDAIRERINRQLKEAMAIAELALLAREIDPRSVSVNLFTGEVTPRSESPSGVTESPDGDPAAH